MNDATQSQINLLRALIRAGGTLCITDLKPMPTIAYKACHTRGWLRDVRQDGRLLMQITEAGLKEVQP